MRSATHVGFIRRIAINGMTLLPFACGQLFAQLGQHRWVALRYDSHRVLVYFQLLGGANNVVAEVQNNGGRLADPDTKVKIPIFELTPGQVGRLRGAIDGFPPRLGVSYILLLGHGQRAKATSTTLIGSIGGSNRYVGFLATVAAPDLLRFQSTGEQYYVLCDYFACGQAQWSNPSVAAGISHRVVPAAIQAQMRTILEKRLDRELPRILADPRTYSHAGPRTRTFWNPLDAALRAGKGRLMFKAQRVRIVDGVRYYVRAQWDVRGTPAFLLTVWMAPEPALHIVSVDSTSARTMRLPECGKSPPGINRTDELLNAVDLGKGRTGIVALKWSYEGFKVELWYYCDQGLLPAGAGFGDGG